MHVLNPYKQTNLTVQTGRMLIAEPYLADTTFARSVIFIADHTEEGTVGFMLNRRTDLGLGDILPEIRTDSLPIFHGGPVQVDTLHMLHRTPELLGGTEVTSGVYWGGSFESLEDAVQSDLYRPHDMRMLVGYAGWSPKQLQEEIEKKSWIVAEANPELLFNTDPADLWRKAIESLGREFVYLAHLPINPQLN